MSDSNLPAVQAPGPYRGLSSRDLAKAIFEADVPENVLRTLPPQSLFMVVRQNGLQSSVDLIEMASVEQCRLILDFDLWHKDSLNEESFWEWLALTDASDGLELLQKLVKCIDLKLIALFIEQYVEVRILENPTEQPPENGFYTPDKGFTWLRIKTEDADKHFLLARLLALIFETNPELFYQLLSIPGVATRSVLEEESFQERTKRLANEGVPEPEMASKVIQPLNLAEALKMLGGANREELKDIPSISPLLYEKRTTGLFDKLVREVLDKEALESEFTYIMNCAVVFWNVDFFEIESVLALSQKVKGAINIGLETLNSNHTGGLKLFYEKLGLIHIYRLGLKDLFDIRKTARSIPIEAAEKQKENAAAFSTLACAREAFPEMPEFLNDDGSVQTENGALLKGQRPIDSIKSVGTIKGILAGLKPS